MASSVETTSFKENIHYTTALYKRLHRPSKNLPADPSLHEIYDTDFERRSFQIRREQQTESVSLAILKRPFAIGGENSTQLCATEKKVYILKTVKFQYPSNKRQIALEQKAATHKIAPKLYSVNSTQTLQRFCELGDFGVFLDRKKATINEEILHYFCAQLMHTVAKLHEIGIAHCDLKLGNIGVKPNSYYPAPMNHIIKKPCQIKLFDFGGAVDIGDNKHTHLRNLGTKIFSPPEVHLTPFAPLDLTAIDAFSLGLVLYILNTGRHIMTTPLFKQKGQKYEEFLKTSDQKDVDALHEECALKIPNIKIRTIVIHLLRYNPKNRWTVAQARDFFHDSSSEQPPLTSDSKKAKRSHPSQPQSTSSAPESSEVAASRL